MSIPVEVCLLDNSSIDINYIKDNIYEFLKTLQSNNQIIEGLINVSLYSNIHILSSNISYIRIGKIIDNSSQCFQIYIYQLNNDDTINDIDTIGDEEITTSQQWILPITILDGLWDSLIYEDNLKDQLLKYVSTSLKLSQYGVDSNIITWNRVVLLHGPPGTGKTSLCKALAQKIAIRFYNEFSSIHLVEINAHSLFSKWFSESGKLVMKLFSRIKVLLEDEDSFVCILIDEVESLAGARTSAMSGSDPSDAIRVVNALLTQIDQLKEYKNILILTTSNITGAIDLAFVDRADIKQYIGPPSTEAIYKILSSCISELCRKNIITNQCAILNYHWLEQMKEMDNEAVYASLQLYDISLACKGFSGRKLRKLPFLALALEVHKTPCKLKEYLDALLITVKKENNTNL